jgi:RNA polymerase sigma-70 factor (ECF subfamily)
MAEASQQFAALIAHARQGDASALRELAQQYEDEVRVVARVLLGPALRPYLDSIDLVQSVHKSLMLGLRRDRFDITSPEKLVALAVEMVRRKIGRKWRHLRKQRRFDTPTDSSTATPPWAGKATPQIGPAENAQLNDAVLQVCRSLTAAERRIIDLRLEGNSIVSIAKQLGMDDHVLRARMSRLRQRLREAGALTEWL